MKKHLGITLIISVAMALMCGCGGTAGNGSSEIKAETTVEEVSTEDMAPETVEETETETGIYADSEWVGTYAGVFGSVLSLKSDGTLKLYHNLYEGKDIATGSWHPDNDHAVIEMVGTNNWYFVELSYQNPEEYYVLKGNKVDVFDEVLSKVDSTFKEFSEEEYCAIMKETVFKIEDLPEKPVKSGYDHGTNQKIICDGIEFEIPDYYKEVWLEDARGFGFAENNNEDIVVYMYFKNFENTTAFFPFIYNAPGHYFDGCEKDGSRLLDVSSKEFAGFDARMYTIYDGTSNGFVRMVSINNDKSNKTVFVSFVQPATTELDYFEDFNRIIENAHVVGGGVNNTLPVEETHAGGYEGIYDEYVELLKKNAPRLAAEFTSEIQGKSYDVQTLAQLSINKTSELAAISTEGTGKMASYMLEHGDDYQEYNEWANKLNSVYIEEARQISDVYMDAARQSR